MSVLPETPAGDAPGREFPELPGLPGAAVDAWFRATLPSRHLGRPWSGEVISGGLSNITYRVRLAGGTVIVRRPPLGHVLPRAHDMRREHRVLTALAASGYRVPAPLGLCTDAGVIGADFYVMPEVPGTVLRSAADSAALRQDQRADAAAELVRLLVRLHRFEPDAIGLGDFGRRGGYSARQLRTWSAQWERSRTRELPDMERLIAQLGEHLPEDTASVVVHGDYRLDNTIVDTAGPVRIAAVLDWELSTIGDPIADLALMLTYWHDAGDDERATVPVAVGITALPGFPTAAQVAERYAGLSGSDLRTLPFHLALGAMKLAVILEGVHARFLGGQTVSTGYEAAGPAVPLLVARGLRLLHG
jgi:aminoglycoside phosphotransferase (APT) family kinase protein